MYFAAAVADQLCTVLLFGKESRISPLCVVKLVLICNVSLNNPDACESVYALKRALIHFPEVLNPLPDSLSFLSCKD